MSENNLMADKLLKAIQEEERDKTRGHLKIFFGYAAGVGKTYAMLKSAHEAKQRGIDVVAGYIEPHYHVSCGTPDRFSCHTTQESCQTIRTGCISHQGFI